MEEINEQLTYYKNKLTYETDSSDLFDAIKNGEKIIVIDARKVSAYNVEHIPSAINIPHREMNETTTKNFNKDVIYVVYCDGIGCNASTKGALNMTKLGFNVKELIGGIQWWKYDGYPTETTCDENTDTTKTECSC